MSEENKILEEVLRLYDEGLCPLPTEIGKKHPIVDWKQYQQGNRPSREQIIEWFKEGKYNIFVPTGRAYNIAIVDLDLNEYGVMSDEAEEIKKQLPATRVHRTGSGGEHYIFSYPEGVDIPTGAGILPGVDIRSDGGGIIWISSIHENGNYYECIEDIESAEFPVDLFKEQFERKRQSSVILDVTTMTVTEGMRSSTLMSYAGTVYRQFSDRPELAKILVLGLNQKICNPPLSEDEIEKTILTSIVKYHPPSSKETTWTSPISKKQLSELKSSPVQYLVDKVIPEQGTTVISGNPGNYKTWTILDIANAIASGNPLFGKFSTKQGAVWIIDKENKPAAIQQRFKMLGGSDDLPIYISSTRDFFISRYTRDKLLETALEKDVKLIIFDSLRRIHPGDENSSMDVAKVFDLINSLHSYGISALLTHHHRKPQGSPFQDSTSKMRGSTDILASIDCHLIIERAGDRQLRLEQNKNRYDDTFSPMILRIDTDTKSYFNFAYNGASKPVQSKDGQLAEAICGYLNDRKIGSRTEVINSVGKSCNCDYNAVDRALGLLLEEGKITKEKNGKEVQFKVNNGSN